MVRPSIRSLAGAFDLARDERRRRLVLALIGLALVSPDVALPFGLPAVRLDQVLLAVFLPAIIRYLRDRGDLWSRADLVFGALALAMTASIALGPLVTGRHGWSPRDAFDILRVAQYWLLFRLAGSLPVAGTVLSLRRGIEVAAIGLGLLGLLQYLHPGPFNSVVTAIWTTGHNLDGVQRAGRIVGTSGNANEFALLGILLALGAVATLALDASGQARSRLIAFGALAAGVFIVVASQSRTGLMASIAAAAALWLAVRFRRRPADVRWRPALAVIAGALIASVALMTALPPQTGTVADRFSILSIATDPSVVIRVARLRAIFGGPAPSAGTETLGECGSPRAPSDPAPGHNPAAPTGAAAVGAEARSRDAKRKTDVATIATAVASWICAHGHWPAGSDPAAVLVPANLPALPTDPSGAPYLFFAGKVGFVVGAQLEDPTDPAGPIFTMGTTPSMVLGSSFDQGDGVPDDWAVAGAGSVATIGAPRLFGGGAARVTLAPPLGTLYQNVVFPFSLDHPYSASLWARAGGSTETRIELRLVAIMSDGRRLDPYGVATVTLPADGRWVRPTVTIRTPAKDRVTTLEIMIRGGGGQAVDAIVDGATLTEGPIPVSYPTVTDVDPAQIPQPDSPTFADSPVVGAGPMSDEQLGAVDNEYASMLLHFGVLGFAAYVGLLLLVAYSGLRAFRAEPMVRRPLGLAVFAWAIAIAVFDAGNGVFYDFQLMTIVVTLAGICWAPGRPPDAEASGRSE